MRPVNRGACPCDDSGRALNFHPEYANARGELIKRLGEYCSFCESRLQAGLHVEHILPKRPEGHNEDMPERVGDWNNFLLACVNCNSHKARTEFPDGECMFPDRCDTFSAITYSEGGQARPSASLPQRDRQRALNLIELVGLNARPATKQKLKRMSDRRWLNRRKAWNMAQDSHNDVLNNIDNAALLDNIVKIVIAGGHWSIWMQVFNDIPEFKEKLISQFPGTARQYFTAMDSHTHVPAV